MNISQMRIIDLYLGGLVCLFLDVYERLRRLFCGRSNSPRKIKKILVTKYFGMGSILLATPVIKALRDAYPESHLVFLTFEQNADFVRRINCFDEVRCFRTSTFSFFVWDLFSILPTLRREKFDLVLDFEFFARFPMIISYLSGGAMRIGYFLPKLWRGELTTHSIYFNPYRHVTEVFAAQLAPLKLKIVDTTIIPPNVTVDATLRITSMLGKFGCSEKSKLIIVNPNASDLSTERRWPLEYFAALISVAAALPDRRIILIGSPCERSYVGKLYSQLTDETKQSVFNLAGELSVDDFIALLSLGNLCISNDSGPLHIAAALGTPTVSFFGPETPTLYGPVGKNHEVFYAGLYCSPCLYVYNAKRALCNGNNICMQQISPEAVIQRLLEKGIL